MTRSNKVDMFALQEELWALILSFCEDNETDEGSSAESLRKTSYRMDQILSSHQYYYAANQLLGRFFTSMPRRRR